jgi:hypothetical protein
VTEQKRRRIDLIQEPGFTDGLGDLDFPELRRRRDLCGGLDVELSYYRRMLHGRMDLLAFELRRRRGEETRTLMEALPEILAGDPEPLPPRPGGESRTIPIEAPDLPAVGRRPVDRALDDDFLARLTGLSDADLDETARMLAEVEEEISSQRRKVFDALDLIQEEITRRYREGLADPADLLD